MRTEFSAVNHVLGLIREQGIDKVLGKKGHRKKYPVSLRRRVYERLGIQTDTQTTPKKADLVKSSPLQELSNTETVLLQILDEGHSITLGKHVEYSQAFVDALNEKLGKKKVEVNQNANRRTLTLESVCNDGSKISCVFFNEMTLYLDQGNIFIGLSEESLGESPLKSLIGEFHTGEQERLELWDAGRPFTITRTVISDRMAQELNKRLQRNQVHISQPHKHDRNFYVNEVCTGYVSCIDGTFIYFDEGNVTMTPISTTFSKTPSATGVVINSQ